MVKIKGQIFDQIRNSPLVGLNSFQNPFHRFSIGYHVHVLVCLFNPLRKRKAQFRNKAIACNKQFRIISLM